MTESFRPQARSKRMVTARLLSEASHSSATLRFSSKKQNDGEVKKYSRSDRGRERTINRGKRKEKHAEE